MMFFSLFLVVTMMELQPGATEDVQEASLQPDSKQGLYYEIAPLGIDPFALSYQRQRSPVNLGFEYAMYGYSLPPSKTSESSQSRRDMFLLMTIISYLFRPASLPTTSTAPDTTSIPDTTVTNFPGTCQWNPWSSCSKVCNGTRYRTRTCLGKSRSESEFCNTQTGFLGDGLWYRASNCYDYYTDRDNGDYYDALDFCESVGARLASTGMRDTAIRTDVCLHVKKVFGDSTNTFTLIGVTTQSNENVFEWSDGYVGYPTFWARGEPTSSSTWDRCYILDTLSAKLLRTACDSRAWRRMCERAAQ